ncbi:MAG: DUF429 domain-containing protein [Micromonosporaceae bacterium]|nr:DUF429 domain-containing protein [Micromonosporaceae bacterium]
MLVLGVDACRAGWVAVRLEAATPGDPAVPTFAGAALAPTLTALPDWSSATTTAVDIPLGLLDTGWRAADTRAAAAVGPRRGSVFRVPPRQVWDEPEYAAANLCCRRLTGAGLARQTFGLRAKLLEANALRDAGQQLYEVHPELSFRTMAGAPLRYAKTSWSGVAMRRALLAGQGIVLPDEPGPAGRAAPDDVLDAAAVAWSAYRIATGRAGCLPEVPQVDRHGRPVAIWY